MARPHLESTLGPAMTKSSTSPTEVIPMTLQGENSADVRRLGTNSHHMAETLQHRKPAMMHSGRRELGRSSGESNGMAESTEASAVGSRSQNDEFRPSSREFSRSKGGRENVEELGTAFASQKQGLRPSSRNSVSLSKRWVDDREALDVVVSARKEELQPGSRELGQLTNVVSQGWCNSSMGATDATPDKQAIFSDLRGLESTGSLNSAAFGPKNLRPSSGYNFLDSNQFQICIPYPILATCASTFTVIHIDPVCKQSS